MNLVTAVLTPMILGSVVGCVSTRAERRPDERSLGGPPSAWGPPWHQSTAEQHGWLRNYERGVEILRSLSALDRESAKRIEISAYRGERVAFAGGAAPPGGTNDLVTEGGFYLRVVNKGGKDLRPLAVSWEVLVFGEVLQVLPQNRIIVIEVNDEDWIILQTM
jgi:hypothetical protein